MVIVENPTQRFLFADHFIDRDTGQEFSESPHRPGYVHATDIMLCGLGLPAAEGARYLDGHKGQTPNFGTDLAYEGSSKDVITMAIHPIDVPKFVQRVNAWRAVTEDVMPVRHSNGTIGTRQPDEQEYRMAMDIIIENQLFWRAMIAKSMS